MRILLILTLILIFNLIGFEVVGWFKKRRINVKTGALI